MMTKKDYIAIAKVVSTSLDGKYISLNHYATHLATELAVVMAQDNPNFDREKFLKACGVK